MKKALQKWRAKQNWKKPKRKNYKNLELLSKRYQNVFEKMNEDGLTLKAQTQKLKRLGVPTQMGKSWHINSVVRVRKTLGLARL